MTEILNNGFIRVTNQEAYIRVWYKNSKAFPVIKETAKPKLIGWIKEEEEKFFVLDKPNTSFEWAIKEIAKQALKAKRKE